MSEELGVRSEELPAVLRRCSTAANVEDCIGCQLKNEGDLCYDRLMQDAADEIERLTAERKYLLKTAASEWLCGSCRHGVMAGKPCTIVDDIYDCEDCGKCICAECCDGDKWVWDGKEV